MINVNGEILPTLEDSEYKLLSVLCNYGKKSYPSNDVILARCGWKKTNLAKLNKAKKGLVSKGILTITPRYVLNESGKRVRGSNQHEINSKLVSKYRGKETNLGNIELLNFQQYTFQQLNFQQLNSEQFNFQQYKSVHVENCTDNKVLNCISIELYKLLNNSKNKEIEEKDKEIEDLKRQLAELKENKEPVKNVVVSSEPPSALPFKKEFLTICTKFREITGKELRVGKTDALIKRSDKYKRIKARLKEGATVEEMIAVIEHKTEQWKNDKKMQQYLRIATLFNASNYEAYIDEIQDKIVPIQPPPKDENLPNFENADARFKYFLFRFEKYRKQINVQEGNRLKKEALNKKQAERVCRMLENKYPFLTEKQQQHEKV